MPDYSSFLISVVVPLLVGSLPAVLTYLLGRRRAAAEGSSLRVNAAASLTNAATALIDDLRQEIDRLSEQNGEKQRALDILTARVRRLEDRVRQLETENEELRCLLAKA